MHKIALVLVIALGVLGALWLGGAGMFGFVGFGMGPGMLSVINTILSPTVLLIIVGVGMLGVVLLARTPRHAAAAAGRTPMEISKTRYAKGEISKEQYDGIKHDLNA